MLAWDRLPRPRLRRRNRKRVDRARWPHQYTGPVNKFGLAPGPCRIERRWAGGYIIITPGAGRFTVPRDHVETQPAP